MLFRVNGLLLEMRLNATGGGEQSRGVTTLKHRLPGQHYVPQTRLCLQSYVIRLAQAQTVFISHMIRLHQCNSQKRCRLVHKWQMTH